MFSERETGKLFSESFDSVAVMFASLPSYINFFSEAEIHQEYISIINHPYTEGMPESQQTCFNSVKFFFLFLHCIFF